MKEVNEQKISLAEKAYELIEEMIVTLELPPGTAFTEGDLSVKLGIGRTPIREALQRLAADGLVTSLSRRGIVVTDINIAEHLVLLETRRVLDRLIASRAAKRATREQRQQLNAFADAIESAVANENLAEFLHLDRESDLVLEAASRNPFAVRAREPLHAHCRRFWYMYQENGDLNQSAKLHADVLKIVSQGDESGAAQAIDRLVDYLDKFTRSVLD